ncbi:MAG: protein phosphatase 2C domain-containing protein [Oscillospiraceae bacterium]|nr:protein phosphatase 2C domain-containing protein [Oscillospiraceae bacterium]
MDSLLLAEREVSGVPVLLSVVCDGVGSLADGALAGTESVRLLNEWFYGLTDLSRAGVRLRDEVSIINLKIVADSAKLGVTTATTLSALLLVDGHYYIVHSGDSRIYEVGCNRLIAMTTDTVNELGKLTSCIGRHEKPELHYAEGIIDCNLFLLCSDGLYKRVSETWIFENIRADTRKSLRKTLSDLSNYAIEQGERDNISIAIIKIV